MAMVKLYDSPNTREHAEVFFEQCHCVCCNHCDHRLLCNVRDLRSYTHDLALTENGEFSIYSWYYHSDTCRDSSCISHSQQIAAAGFVLCTNFTLLGVCPFAVDHDQFKLYVQHSP